MVAVICVIIAGLTEVTSNVATANILLPVMAEVARVTRVNPLYLMIPATLVSSLAFLLPVSTAPNAIVHAAGGLRTWDMMRAGAGLTVVTMFTTIASVATIGVPVFSTDTFPDWAQALNNTDTSSAASRCLQVTT